MIDPRLARLLDVQGQLLDKFIEQNMGERYFYTIVVSPLSAPCISAISNAAKKELITPMLRELSRTLTGAEPVEMVDMHLQHGSIITGGHGNA